MRTILVFALVASAAEADTLKLANGGTLEGIVLRETETSYVVKLKYGTVTLAKSDVASVEKSKAEPAKAGARLALWERCVEVVVARPGASDFRPIPATVIDKGILKHVPYFSHRAGEYEFNIYGDPDAPACLEIGVYKDLVKSDAAKKECLEVMLALLGDEKDREALKSLDLKPGKPGKTEREGLTFEVTPETAEDAYGGWWISVYDVKRLDAARATEKELAEITVSDEEVEKEEKEAEEEKKKPKPQAQPPQGGTPPKTTPAPHDPYWHYRWAVRDLPLARPRIQSTPRRVYVRGYLRSGGRYARPSWGVRGGR